MIFHACVLKKQINTYKCLKATWLEDSQLPSVLKYYDFLFSLGDPFKELRNSEACLSNMTVDLLTDLGCPSGACRVMSLYVHQKKRSLGKDKRGLFWGTHLSQQFPFHSTQTHMLRLPCKHLFSVLLSGTARWSWVYECVSIRACEWSLPSNRMITEAMTLFYFAPHYIHPHPLAPHLMQKALWLNHHKVEIPSFLPISWPSTLSPS